MQEFTKYSLLNILVNANFPIILFVNTNLKNLYLRLYALIYFLIKY